MKPNPIRADQEISDDCQIAISDNLVQMDLQIVYLTFPDSDAAKSSVRILLNERLIACANIVPGVSSLYWWKGKIEESSETLVIAKTTKESISKLKQRYSELHSYENPEFLSVDVDSISDKYRAWILDSISPSEK